MQLAGVNKAYQTTRLYGISNSLRSRFNSFHCYQIHGRISKISVRWDVVLVYKMEIIVYSTDYRKWGKIHHIVTQKERALYFSMNFRWPYLMSDFTFSGISDSSNQPSLLNMSVQVYLSMSMSYSEEKTDTSNSCCDCYQCGYRQVPPGNGSTQSCWHNYNIKLGYKARELEQTDLRGTPNIHSFSYQKYFK